LHANRRCCAAAFYFLSRNTALRADLVHVGATAIIAQVALNTKSPRVALSCAASLCNLSLEPGVEGRLAEEGAVGALCTLLLTFSQREVWSISLQALYNLSCVTEVRQPDGQRGGQTDGRTDGRAGGRRIQDVSPLSDPTVAHSHPHTHACAHTEL